MEAIDFAGVKKDRTWGSAVCRQVKELKMTLRKILNESSAFSVSTITRQVPHHIQKYESH